MRPPFQMITARQAFGFGALALCASFTGQVRASGFIDAGTVAVLIGAAAGKRSAQPSNEARCSVGV